jgi:hypothetical protein
VDGDAAHLTDIAHNEVCPFNLSVRSKMARKQSSSKVSTLASKVLSGTVKPTPTQSKTLAASVLSQDEVKGKKH